MGRKVGGRVDAGTGFPMTVWRWFVMLTDKTVSSVRHHFGTVGVNTWFIYLFRTKWGTKLEKYLIPIRGCKDLIVSEKNRHKVYSASFCVAFWDIRRPVLSLPDPVNLYSMRQRNIKKIYIT